MTERVAAASIIIDDTGDAEVAFDVPGEHRDDMAYYLRRLADEMDDDRPERLN